MGAFNFVHMRGAIILLAITLTACLSCGNPKELVYQDVKNFKLYELSLNPEIGMDIQFYNPNKYGMTLKDANIDVFINDKLVGKSSLTQTFHVPGADTFLLPVKLRTDLKGLFANTISIIANKKVKMRLDGYVKAGKGIFLPVPIHYEGTQRLDVFDLK